MWSLTLFQGSLTELMGDPEGAIDAYQQALRHNQWSVAAMNAISHILRAREKFPEAMEYLRSILKLDPNNGDVWGSLGESELAAANKQN
jgi:general transcriptional corepressor CYC8